eukprot:TRINITY_DN3205_c0_g1_i1.p1 TRINITY_DN3205_c0_g1~~TRINITY_DN3205_c0_g1_i1.p1  ORF type:complete len:309 (-),score=78.05 TRINITY_DN3205_c0_g1_i1:186-1112(-)
MNFWRRNIHGDQYKDTHADRNKLKLLFCGATAGGFSRTAVAPLSRITILFMVSSMEKLGIGEQYTNRGTWQALKETYKNEGIMGFYKGNGTHFIKKIPFSAIKFLSYERFKQVLTPRDQQDARIWRRLMAGAAAAVVSVVLTYPLDLVHTHLSVQTSKSPKYSGIIGTLRTIAKEEGVRQWYRGLNVTLISVIPYVSINMTLWENFKMFFLTKYDLQDPFISSVCGALSGTIASTVTFPLDVLRRHIQLNSTRTQSYLGYSDAIKRIWEAKGWRGFYRGIWPHYLSVIPITAISFGIYDLMKSAFHVT